MLKKTLLHIVRIVGCIALSDIAAAQTVTGELDDPSTHADDTRRDMEKLGIPTGLTIVPDSPHAFLGQQRSFDLAVEACDAFFKRHLRSQIEAVR